jgi:predicted nucleic acid-binding protein
VEAIQASEGRVLVPIPLSFFCWSPRVRYADSRHRRRGLYYIYDETVTLTLTRGESFVAAKHIGEKLRGDGPYPQTYELLRVSTAVFADAVDLFERYDDQAVSFTDATTVALAARHDIDCVISFDDDFDGIVDRVDPATI